MIAQLALNGTEVRVCTGCGLARDEAVEGYYPRQNERCAACRIRDGEELYECDGCGEDTLDGDLYTEAFYFSPFDDEERESGFRFCYPCIDQGNDNVDGTEFYCDGCERKIASDNGRMLYYRILNDCEQVCLKCIEEDLKAGGIAAIDDDAILERLFAGDNLFGMFFNVGELEAEGWTPDPLYHDYRCGGGEETVKLGARAHGWHKAGRLIIVGYESLSIIGGVGYVTLFTKEKAAA